MRLRWLQALRIQQRDNIESVLREALTEDTADVRLFALRWIGDERLMALCGDVARLLEEPPADARYYLAVLATLDWLDKEPEMRERDIADELLVRELENQERSAVTHALALGLLSPDNEFLTVDRLSTYLESEHRALRTAAVRSLSQRTKADRFDLLAIVAGDEGEYEDIRAEAVVGLSAAAEEHKELLESLAKVNNETVAHEAERALRLSGLLPVQPEKKPPADDLAAWVKLLNEPGDVQSGQRLFFSPVAARCGVCHQYGGRGGRIGPDLTNIAKSSTREKLIASIMRPDEEIAPHYQPWLLVTDDGKTHTGLRLHEGGDDGSEEYVNSAGERFLLESKSIEVREATATSIMPSGLEKLVSIADLRDLVAFLTTAAE